MMTPNSDLSGHDRVDEQLPFDPLTLVRALRRRWRWALGATAGAMVLGALAGLAAGERVCIALADDSLQILAD